MEPQVPPSVEVTREPVIRAWDQVTTSALGAFDSQTVRIELRERLWSAEHEVRLARGLDHLPDAALRLARAEFALAQAQINLDAHLRDHT